ncbi:MAG: excinuclease ABC subunit UvrC [Deltaproteobacteria bacterium]|nr:excinuclease ABC subunit UvrC [Deltaproteobacteria bacterium]MBW2136545.1 excinuclease ABC subunit UvrC [Deltaproteobacteria bacterium]
MQASRNPNLELERSAQRAPEAPGVYLFREKSGKIIYVGKAKNLKKRVLSYFKSSNGLSPKTAMMMSRAKSLEYMLTSTEKEAFILESNLVKKHLPRYNIVLRDDKQYPCLRLDIQNPYPRLVIVRKIKKDGALYFGPYSSANSVRSTMKLIDRIFHLRKCKGLSLPKRTRPCLNYQLGRCLGVCVNEVSDPTYREIVEQVKLFLEGRNQELTNKLEHDMVAASDSLNFERAAKIRDQIRALERVMERQNVVSTRLEDRDVIAMAEKEGSFLILILFVRKGYLTGSGDYQIKQENAGSSEVMEAFIKQYYSRESFIPGEILVSRPIEDHESITEWISELAGKRVRIRCPVRGEKRKLVMMALKNARELLIREDKARTKPLGEVIRDSLRLHRIPRVIEGIDISNIQGDLAVGAVVSFVDGRANKKGYRNYRIRGVKGVDDYGMIAELARRRLSKADLPDLFLVDGGKGHLNAVKKMIHRFSPGDPPEVVALAKPGGKDRSERIYLPNRKNPVLLNPDHPALLFFMRVRDEAHRRAILYYRTLSKRGFKESVLDETPGLGPRKKKQILRYFGGLDKLIDAEIEDLVKVPGIGPSLAQRIYESVTMKGEKNY